MSSALYSAPPVTEPVGGKVRVLVVDDQPDNLLSAQAVLETLGEEIVTVESGRDALLQVLDRDFAVILLDIMMPGMDGFETAELIHLRERSRNTPIIFLTALGRNEEHVLRGYNTGAVDYIVKPFVPEILRAKVGVFVELARKSAMLEARNAELQMAVERQQRAEAQVLALNQRLEQRVRELAEVNRDLESFSYTVSHDLRGPLSRMAGFSKALLESFRTQLDATGRRYLERIESSATRMCELVDDLLNFSRASRVHLERRAVDLSDCARSIAAELTARDPSRKAEFVIAEGVIALADPGLMQAAMLNLFENAWKFTGKHDSARIEFGVKVEAGVPVYFIRDDGAGFDMAEARDLFVPFHRLHRDPAFEGTGIGLASVARIVARHGGRIWAEAEVERGATFCFSLWDGGTA